MGHAYNVVLFLALLNEGRVGNLAFCLILFDKGHVWNFEFFF